MRRVNVKGCAKYVYYRLPIIKNLFFSHFNGNILSCTRIEYHNEVNKNVKNSVEYKLINYRITFGLETKIIRY